jgi:hypothetical protein
MDVGVFGSVWLNETRLRTWVDFNTKHVCRDFDAIRAWAERNQIPEDEENILEPPGEGVRIWDVPP